MTCATRFEARSMRTSFGPPRTTRAGRRCRRVDHPQAAALVGDHALHADPVVARGHLVLLGVAPRVPGLVRVGPQPAVGRDLGDGDRRILGPAREADEDAPGLRDRHTRGLVAEARHLAQRPRRLGRGRRRGGVRGLALAAARASGERGEDQRHQDRALAELRHGRPPCAVAAGPARPGARLGSDRSATVPASPPAGSISSVRYAIEQASVATRRSQPARSAT